ncbi:outer membrane beta-barrel protein [Sphingobacterium sp. DK4209]|uniref:Outer membrane beta-barrel protein n=1 Tax=Sphingobacterium zhuxiongii TaxID=2662364 RepID=A0A5Q0QGX4_9SPHI|nr:MULTISPECIES: outer membrane beta-barrel protein [unclassified Sphingobacterium]MVZ64613.1 outer membrane beta-barrel protein [Sphingobacterium sp. DK4209]QGA26952.1 outer membrane beta-barrel protein [Sphingobacterium sp. dk4302]
MKHTLFFIIPLIFCSSLNAQTIKGKVYFDNNTVEYASIRVFNKSDSLLGSYLSDRVGYFQSKKFVDIEDFKIHVSHVGAVAYQKQFKSIDLLKPIVIHLEKKTIDTVEISINKNNSILDLNKRIFRFNQDDFIKNTTADIAMNKGPGVIFADGIGLKLDGSQLVKLYVDGIETSNIQLKSIDISDIDRIEIINNSTARFNAEGNFAIINVITKPRKHSFYKGRVGFTKGLLLKRTGIDPSFSFKREKWLIKTELNYYNYDQETNIDIFRNTLNVPYRQNNYRETEIKQLNADINIKYDVDTTSFIFLKSNYYLYKLLGETTGNINDVQFANHSIDKYWIFSTDLVYDKKMNNAILSLKAKYNLYRKNDFYKIENNQLLSNSINSGLSDISIEANYNHKPNFFIKTQHDFGLKYVNREYLIVDSDNYKQRNYGLYSDWNIRLNEKIDISPSLFLDISNNDVNNKINTYVSFLPSFNISYKPGKTNRVSFAYTRKINRPNPMDLNENIIVIDPTTVLRGNVNLKQSSLNTLNLSYSSPYKKNYFSTNIYYSFNRNAVFQNIENIQDILIYTKDNIGDVQRVGIMVGHDMFIRKGMNLYTSIGANYSSLDKNGNNPTFNSGYGFIGTVNFSAKVFKKITTNLLFDYNSRRYDLYSMTKERPFTSLLMSTNILKDKINVRCSYVDLFKVNAKREIHLMTPNFTQSTYQNRNFSNLNLSVIYMFGKKFSDSANAKTTKYDDIELR